MPIAIAKYDRLAGDVLALYEQAEQRMLQRIADRLAKGQQVSSWAQQKYAEVVDVNNELREIVKRLKTDRNKLTDGFVTMAYDQASGACTSDAKKYTDLANLAKISTSTRKTIAILADAQNVMDTADRMILRKANDAYADIVAKSSALAATGTITIREAVQRELDAFADKGITSFVDKNGRSWEMATYAEMATLTAIERATLSGYVDTMESYGFDLAIISSHIGACPLCQSWHDVVISVSGRNPDYPSLSDAEAGGCFHPRCLHYFTTYYDGISRPGKNAPTPVKEPSTGYSARQHQRQFERKIRQWKRRMAVATDPQTERVAYARVRLYQQRLRDLRGEYNDNNDEHDTLPRKYWREGGAVRLSAEAKKLKPVRIQYKKGAVNNGR